ncbi:hypothetical protein N7462_009765 [Penicillium macrosclerotiorum]|uniref:uncharacterized protein n=1 Tax=Penicillium macrosclerotiorum TaxID=303699 RepID=UPI002547EDA9|nr:uncharacterized protein N7462_009765 [Penicillium macrosclerotiorum]KAJ5668695.1 hypothetical protein N7462_009765 [Penicillium macrosclerotiorum]
MTQTTDYIDYRSQPVEHSSLGFEPARAYVALAEKMLISEVSGSSGPRFGGLAAGTSARTQQTAQ